MTTPADIVTEAVALANEWNEQARGGAAGEPSVEVGG